MIHEMLEHSGRKSLFWHEADTVRSLGDPPVLLIVGCGLAGCRDSRTRGFFDREVQRVQPPAMLAGAQSMAR
jgi:hypothetical protein